MSTVIDPIVAQWLDEDPREGSPAGLQRALAATRQVEQRSRLRFPNAWLPRSVVRPGTRPHIGLAPLLLIATLLLILALAAAYVGSRPRPTIPVSIGPAAQRLVAYQDGGSISVARIDGTYRRTISGDLTFAQSPVFSPDGSKVAFIAARNAATKRGDLFVVPIDDSGPPTPVSHGVGVVIADAPEFSWSPDSTQIAFAGGDQNAPYTDIYLAQADGSGVAGITDSSMKRDLPTWSRIPNRIAYRATSLDGSHTSLWYMEPSGTNVVQVAAVIASDGALSRIDWSPANRGMTPMTENGAAIWLVSYTEAMGFGSPSQAVIEGLQTSQVLYPWTRGIGGLQTYGAPWSPDGQWIAILTANDGVVLAQYDTHGVYSGEIRHLGNVADCWIDWSPDGTALYGGSPDGCTGTVVIPIDDPASAFVTYTPMSGVTSWQPLAP